MNKFLSVLNFLPLIFIVLGMVAFTVAGYLYNAILGTVLIGITLIVTGVLIIPLKIGGK